MALGASAISAPALADLVECRIGQNRDEFLGNAHKTASASRDGIFGRFG
jgi:hypothetical protein